jgi:hypothetical protein
MRSRALSIFLTWTVLMGIPFGAAAGCFAHFLDMPWTLGVPCGVGFGAVMGAACAFQQRKITITIPVGANRESFLSQLALYLANIGYHPTMAIADTYTFRPSFGGGIANGRLTVHVGQTQATFVGSAHVVRTLVARVRYVYGDATSPYRA